MPNNTGQFAARVQELRDRLEAAQQRLAGVAQAQNGLLERLALQELEQQKERIGTYQIQARFALASIYDRAAVGVPAPPANQSTESQGELEVVPRDGAPTDAPVEPSAPNNPPAETPPAQIPPSGVR